MAINIVKMPPVKTTGPEGGQKPHQARSFCSLPWAVNHLPVRPMQLDYP